MVVQPSPPPHFSNWNSVSLNTNILLPTSLATGNLLSTKQNRTVFVLSMTDLFHFAQWLQGWFFKRTLSNSPWGHHVMCLIINSCPQNEDSVKPIEHLTFFQAGFSPKQGKCASDQEGIVATFVTYLRLRYIVSPNQRYKRTGKSFNGIRQKHCWVYKWWDTDSYW